MRSLIRSMVLLPVIIAVTSCAHGGGATEEFDEFAEPVNPELTLTVRNDNFYDATLYAVSRGGQRQRLGIVTGNQRGTFKFRWPHDELRVEIQLLAAGGTSSWSMPVTQGDELELIIEANAHLKTQR